MAERIRFELTAADKTKAAFSGVKRGLDRLKKAAFSLKGAFVALLSVAAVRSVFRNLLGAALPFNRAIAETSTLIEGNKQQLDFLRDTARKMASEFGGTGADQVNAFYQAISAGAGTVEQAAALINVANKLAIGGVGDLTTSVGVLTTAMNNYGKAGLTAQDAADILFTGVKFGVTTIGQLGAAIGRTASLASDAGVTFTELVAATAALTTTGITTKEAITGVRAILAAVIKPTSEAQKMAKKLGIEFNAAALKSKGFAVFLKDLMIATGGSVEQLAQLFGGLEGLAPIISLTGAVAEKFAETLDGMTDRAGAMEEAYLKVARALEQRLVVQMGKFSVATEIAGSALLKVLVPALEIVTSNLKLLGAALAFGVATQIPLAIRMFAALAKAITGIGVAAGTARTALALLGGPLGIILGIGSLVVIFFDDLKAALERLFPSMTKVDVLWGRFIKTLRDGNKVIREFLGLSFESELATKIARLRALQDTLSVRAGGGLEAFATMGAGSTKDLNAEQDRLLARIRELNEQKDTLAAGVAGDDAAAAAAALAAAAKAKAAAAALAAALAAGTGGNASGFGLVKALEQLSREATALDLRTELVGKTTRAAAAFRAEQEILLRLKRDHIKLAPEELEQIKLFAEFVGLSAENLKKSKDALAANNMALADQKAALEAVNADIKHIGENFIQMAISGEASFKDMVGAVLQDFIRMETRILSSRLFGDPGGGGGLFGSLLGGIAGLFGGAGSSATSAAGTSVTGTSPVASFAHGGPVRGGKPIKVHAGEVFIPPQNGRILNASQAERMGRGGGGGTVVNIYAPPGSQVEETRSNVSDTEQINVFIDNATATNLNRPGSATFRAMQTTHGTRQQLLSR